jgi:hypothetical protein
MRRLNHIALWSLLALAVFLWPSSLLANQSASGWCEAGATLVVTSGLQSNNQVQGSFPQCLVTVNIHGGGLATIYADNALTPLANPFVAQTGGQFQFYSANGHYDVITSGAGMPTPVTYPDIILNDPVQQSLTQCIIAFNATPTFTANSCSLFSMTLTGNVTSSVVTGATTGQLIAVTLTQGAGGPWTFAWPANFINPPLLTPTAGKSEQFEFVLEADGNWHSLGVGESQVFDTSVNGNVLRINGNGLTAVSGTGGTVILQTSPTINTPTITSPTTTGTDTGTETLTNKSLTSPSITGTVAGGASYTGPTLTSPVITGTVTGTRTDSGNVTLTGTDTVGTLNGAINLDGSQYPKTQTGLTNAITAATSAGTCVNIPPATTISISSSVSWNSSNACLQGSGSTSIITCTGSSSFNCLSFVGTLGGTTSNLTSNSSEGSNTVALVGGGAAALGLSIGDYILISDALAITTYETTRVDNLVGDTITTADPMYESFLTANTAKVQKYTAPLLNVRIGGFTLDLTGQTGATTNALLLEFAINSEVRNLDFVGVQTTAFGMNASYGYKNRFTDLRSSKIGSTTGFNDLYAAIQTGMQAERWFSTESGTFGPGFYFDNGSNISDITSVKGADRGMKLQHSSWNNFTNIQVHSAGSTFIAILLDGNSRRNNFTNWNTTATGGVGGGGFIVGGDTTAQTDNKICNGTSLYNTTDIGWGSNDTNNVFCNVTFSTQSNGVAGGTFVAPKLVQSIRGAACATGAGAGATCNTTLTWNYPWPDTSYSPTCAITGGNVNTMTVLNLTKSTSQIIAGITNGATGGATSGTLECTAMHDP